MGIVRVYFRSAAGSTPRRLVGAGRSLLACWRAVPVVLGAVGHSGSDIMVLQNLAPFRSTVVRLRCRQHITSPPTPALPYSSRDGMADSTDQKKRPAPQRSRGRAERRQFSGVM